MCETQPIYEVVIDDVLLDGHLIVDRRRSFASLSTRKLSWGGGDDSNRHSKGVSISLHDVFGVEHDNDPRVKNSFTVHYAPNVNGTRMKRRWGSYPQKRVHRSAHYPPPSPPLYSRLILCRPCPNILADRVQFLISSPP